MLALAAYEDTLCPNCGRPLSVCTDPATEGKWQVGPPTRCFPSSAIEAAREPYSGGKVRHPNALLFSANLRT